VILYLSNAMNCIGQTKMEQYIHAKIMVEEKLTRFTARNGVSYLPHTSMCCIRPRLICISYLYFVFACSLNAPISVVVYILQ